MPLPKHILFDYVARFFDRRRRERTIAVPHRILMTADDEDWAFRYQGVDAMTAVSNREDEDIVFERLRNEIDRVAGRVPASAQVPPNDSRASIAWRCPAHVYTLKEVIA